MWSCGSTLSFTPGRWHSMVITGDLYYTHKLKKKLVFPIPKVFLIIIMEIIATFCCLMSRTFSFNSKAKRVKWGNQFWGQLYTYRPNMSIELKESQCYVSCKWHIKDFVDREILWAPKFATWSGKLPIAIRIFEFFGDANKKDTISW